MLGEHIWARFCDAIGRPELRDDPRYETGQLRSQRSEEVREFVEDWLASLSRAEAHAQLLAHGVPSAPVEDVDEVTRSPHAKARQMLLPIDDPAWGPFEMAGNPIKSSERIHTPTEPAPRLGQHTAQVLTELLELSEHDLQELDRKGVI